MHTCVHRVTTAPSRLKRSETRSKVGGRLESARVGSPTVECIHPRHTSAWNASSLNVFSFSTTACRGGINWDRAVADEEVTGRPDASAIRRSVCAVRVRPRYGAIQLSSHQRDTRGEGRSVARCVENTYICVEAHASQPSVSAL